MVIMTASTGHKQLQKVTQTTDTSKLLNNTRIISVQFHKFNTSYFFNLIHYAIRSNELSTYRLSVHFAHPSVNTAGGSPRLSKILLLGDIPSCSYRQNASLFPGQSLSAHLCGSRCRVGTECLYASHSWMVTEETPL